MNKISNFIKYLETRLKEPLPGLESHIKMTPTNNGIPIRKITPNHDSRVSSVMLLLTEIEERINILFTLRSQNLGSHSGQISFPGGMREDGENEIETALREVHEEIAIVQDQITIVGQLSQLFVPPSNSVINPIVGYFDSEKVMTIANPDEVEEIFYVDLSDFFNTAKLKHELWNLQGYLCNVPFWDIHNSTPLWGATSMILQEFLDISKPFFSEQVINAGR